METTEAIVLSSFVETDENFLTILKRVPEPRPPVLQAMLDLRDSYADPKAREEAIRAAQTVSLERVDPSLVILFLATWAHASMRERRLAEGLALINRAKSLVTDETPAEVRIFLMDTEGRLHSMGGNNTRRESLLREAMTLLPLEAHRRKGAMFRLALFLARHGRGEEIEEDLNWLLLHEDNPAWKARVALVRFVNGVETGRVEEGERLYAEIRNSPETLGNTARSRRVFLDLIQGRWTPEAVPTDRPPEVFVDRTLHQMALVIHLLLHRRVDEAIRWAREDVRSNAPWGITFTASNLVRAELAAGNGEAARRILDLRRENGNLHYLDDLFYARAEHLAGNKEAAARRFLLVRKAAERYRAEGRVDFELRMAHELSAGDLMRMGAHSERIKVAGEGPAAAGGASPRSPTGAQGADRLLGRSAAISAIRESVLKMAPLDIPILITGETGTGKDLVARAIHEAGPRRDRPFIAVNCGAIADTLLETELFGHERGAFTGAERPHRGFFEEAGAGTVFLDEIGEISPRLQVALLRVLETGDIRPVGSAKTRRISCRIVAATNASLDALAEAGRFRRDVLFRLRRFEIRLLPLRERREDILPLASYFLDLGRREGVRAVMAEEMKRALAGYPWPGNARELRNEIERMRLVNSDRLAYRLEDLDPKIRAGVARPALQQGPVDDEETEDSMRDWDVDESRPRTRNEPGDEVPAPPGGRGPAEGENRRAPRRERPMAAPPQTPPPVETLAPRGRTALRRRERLKDLFRRNRTLTRLEIIMALGISPQTATTDLKTLAGERFIDKVMPNASPQTHYFALREGG